MGASITAIARSAELRERVTELRARGYSSSEAAAELGISARQALRLSGNKGAPPPAIKKKVRARLARQVEDGQPASWVAEGICHPAMVRNLAAKHPDHDEHILEFKRVWSQIRHRPDLVALHREFSPQRKDRK